MNGTDIRARRQAAGMTQAELAARLGVAAENVSRWEHGRLGQSATTRVALEAVLGKVGAKRAPRRCRKS